MFGRQQMVKLRVERFNLVVTLFFFYPNSSVNSFAFGAQCNPLHPRFSKRRDTVLSTNSNFRN